MSHANSGNVKPLLEIDSLEAGDGSVQVLWGVTLSLQSLGVACLIVSNGAGKTTLLRMLSGRVAAALAPFTSGASRSSGPGRTRSWPGA